jgi:hypothetical protein
MLVALPVSRASAQPGETPCERYGKHAITFVGTVAGPPVSRSFVVVPGQKPVQYQVTPMTIDRAYQGIEGSIAYVRSDAYMFESKDRPALQAERSYVVYGHKNLTMWVGPKSVEFAGENIVIPSKIVPLEDGANDAAFLESAALPSATGVIYGRLGRQDGPPVPPKYTPPMPGVTIRLESESSTTEMETRPDGSFLFDGVLPGPVTVTALLPDEAMVNGDGRIFVRPGGCAQLDLVAMPNGRIRGRVVNADGSPRTHQPVDLIELDSEDGRGERPTHTVQDGEFEFNGLPPGRYLVVVRITSAPENSPIPSTYFPGTANREHATPIVVGSGTVHEGIDVMVGGEFGTGELEIYVAGVTPADTLVVCRVKEDSANGSAYPALQVEPLLGPATPFSVLRLIEGERYKIAVEMTRAGQRFRSDTVRVGGRSTRQRITLTPNRPLPANPPLGECTDLERLRNSLEPRVKR